MTGTKYKQLNPFELKSAITELLNKIHSINDIQNCLADFDMLDGQTDKKIITKVLLKELSTANTDKIPIICFLLEHFVPKDELINKLWEVLKKGNLQTEAKITVLNLLRDLDSDWSYETCEEYLDDAKSLLDENTKQLLNSAIINPEVQIDFMDFMATIRVQDKITLLNSLSDDFSSDALANILIPVFVSEPDSAEGKEALKLLANTKSVLAFHVLEDMKTKATGELLQEIKRSLSTIKIAGIREDNTQDFYREILAHSKPDKFYLTYPDGYGNMAMIFTRITEDKKIRFISVVINVVRGILDCFGFFEISQFECDKILDRFLKDEKSVEIDASSFKTILDNAELMTIQNNLNTWKLPYEYVCWKNLMIDIETDNQTIEEILKEQVYPIQIDNSAVDKISQLYISAHWFLDNEYSDEFEDMLKQLKTCTDLDNLVKENITKVFYSEEKEEWIKKLLMCAYVKFAIGKDDQAGMIYAIAQNESVLNELFTQILKRSIYEHLAVIKYNSNVESYGLTHDEIEDKIRYIETKWVHNV